MNSVVIYGSRHGNTRKVAEVIGAELRKHGAVQVIPAEKAPATLPEPTELVVVGGPTEAHRMSVSVAKFFDRLGKDALARKAAAAFDTRLRWPAFLSGSAAAGIVQKLERAGAQVIAPEASFFVKGKLPELELGESERAIAWAASLVAVLESTKAISVG